MDETERYLNNILERRMGSVIPVGGSKKATVTRLPQKEEKM